jgi:hypothetical protein
MATFGMGAGAKLVERLFLLAMSADHTMLLL